MRLLGAFLFVCLPILAEFPSIEKLFTRPYVWGTEPRGLEWSKKGHTLAFLWNAEGGRFLDLYAYHPDEKRLARLTALAGLKDDLLLSDDEKDERQKQYLPPPAGLTGFALSQDGSQAAFTYKGDLWIVKTSGAEPPFRLTRTKAAESGPQWSPDGGRLASIRGGQIVVQDLRTGQLWQVTDIEGGALAGYRWSPDGSRFYYSVRRGQGRQMPLPNYSGRFVTARQFTRTVAGDASGDVDHFLIAHEGGKPQPVDLGQTKFARAVVADWSNDGAALLFTTTDATLKKREIRVADAKTGKSRVVEEQTDPRWIDSGAALFSPDGQTVLFTAERDGWMHLYTVPAAGGAKPQQITRGNWEIYGDRFGEPPQWAGDWIYYVSTEAATNERHYYRIRRDGSGKEKLSTRTGLNIGLVSQDGAHIAMRMADEKNPFDLWVGTERVTQSPQAEFARIAWPDRRYVQFPSRGDRKPVAAQILLPPGYKLDDRSQSPRPAVVYIHGAGIDTSVLKQWGSYNELRYAYNCYLASQGYVVLDLDYRGSTGYGYDWRTGVYLHMGGPDLDDVLGAVDYLKSLGNVDTGRLGIWGASYGGFMTNMAMFQSPGAFKAGSSWAAVNDWENYNAFYTGQRLSTPQQHPEAYRRSSPIHFSGRLQDKLLIVHGMVDDNVLFQDAVQLTEKLIREGKDFAHIYYPEENHGFVRDETWIDALKRTTAWFDRYLKGQ